MTGSDVLSLIPALKILSAIDFLLLGF